MCGGIREHHRADVKIPLKRSKSYFKEYRSFSAWSIKLDIFAEHEALNMTSEKSTDE